MYDLKSKFLYLNKLEMEKYVNRVELSKKEISATAISRTRKLIQQSEILLNENKEMKREIENLKKENSNLDFLCRRNQLLSNNYRDFNKTLQLKGTFGETMDLKQDLPLFPDKPLWEQMRRKTGVSDKIQEVFGRGMKGSKSARVIKTRGITFISILIFVLYFFK